MLELVDVRKLYDGQTALDGVTLTVREGEFLGVVGPSGSGKSTLLHVMGGLLSPTSGDVIFKGDDVYKGNERKLAWYRKRVGFVFQSFNLLNELSVFENILLSMAIAGMREDKKAAFAVLDKVGMLEKWNAKPSTLSVGECQRVAIARCVVRNPLLIFADEPTGSLDTENKVKIMEIFNAVHEEGRTIVVVSHDPSTLKEAERIVELVDGKIVREIVKNGI
ncbi:MAG: ABC transporter ATP-binding protein [Thermotogae bacterium]|nr:ABC transporter ATP-binding protein [Thermotogota bacterium]